MKKGQVAGELGAAPFDICMFHFQTIALLEIAEGPQEVRDKLSLTKRAPVRIDGSRSSVSFNRVRLSFSELMIEVH